MTNVNKSYNLIDGTMQLCPKNKGKYITHTSLAYGDYDNSCSVERANVAYIQENYASNRYHLVTSGWGYNHIYLKNTKLNVELINSLAEYPSIDDEYLSDWESQQAEDQFLDTNLDEFTPIYKALEQFYTDKDVDITQISNSNYFWQLYNAIANEFNTYYHFENSNCVYRSNGFNTDKVVEYCIEYFNEYPMFPDLAIDLHINTDPRGYALKIDDTVMRSGTYDTVKLDRDWGGYGILSPQI